MLTDREHYGLKGEEITIANNFADWLISNGEAILIIDYGNKKIKKVKGSI